MQKSKILSSISALISLSLLVSAGSVFIPIQDLSGYVLNTRTVNGHALSSNVTVTASDLSLGNVDNTSDATKNAASVTLTNKTISGSSNTLSNIAESSVTNLTTDLAAKAGLSSVNAFTGQNTLTPQTLTSSSSHIAWNANSGNSAIHTATENTTLDNPTNLVTGGIYTFMWIQHASSAKTLAYGTKWKFAGSSTVSATTSSVQIISCEYDGTNLDCSMIGPFS